MNAYIHFRKDKENFNILIFPETFYENQEELEALCSDPNINIGFLDTNDIEITPETYTKTEILEEINETASDFPIRFYKSIHTDVEKALERSRNKIDDFKLWETIYWASMFLDEYGDGTYDYMVVGTPWRKNFPKKLQKNTLTGDDINRIVRSVLNEKRAYYLKNTNQEISYDYFYLKEVESLFVPFFKLQKLFLTSRFLRRYSSKRRRDIKEIFKSLENRLKNILSSYDEMNYELFVDLSSRTDYKISNFFTECLSATEDIARLIRAIGKNETRESLFCNPGKLYSKETERRIRRNQENLNKVYFNQTLKDQFNVIRIIRNKMRHGDALTIEGWGITGEFLQTPMLKLYHPGNSLRILNKYADKKSFTLRPFWWGDADKNNGSPPVGYSVPLRESLDYAFDTIVELLNSFFIALLEDEIKINGLPGQSRKHYLEVENQVSEEVSSSEKH